MPRASFLPATLVALALTAATAASSASAAPAYVPGELIVKREGKRVRLFTRNGHDWSTDSRASSRRRSETGTARS